MRHPGRDVQWAIRYVDLELKGEVQRREILDSPVREIMDRKMTVEGRKTDKKVWG